MVVASANSPYQRTGSVNSTAVGWIATIAAASSAARGPTRPRASRWVASTHAVPIAIGSSRTCHSESSPTSFTHIESRRLNSGGWTSEPAAAHALAGPATATFSE